MGNNAAKAKEQALSDPALHDRLRLTVEKFLQACVVMDTESYTHKEVLRSALLAWIVALEDEGSDEDWPQDSGRSFREEKTTICENILYDILQKDNTRMYCASYYAVTNSYVIAGIRVKYPRSSEGKFVGGDCLDPCVGRLLGAQSFSLL